MSYDSKYKGWVEKTLVSVADSVDPKKVFEVYKGIPVIREKLQDDPVEYRFHSPLGRSKDIQTLHTKIDNRLEKPEGTRKTSGRSGSADSQVDYYIKWQNCQMENSDLKKKIDEYRVKFEEIDSAKSRLEKEIEALHNTAESLKKELSETRVELDKQRR